MKVKNEFFSLPAEIDCQTFAFSTNILTTPPEPFSVFVFMLFQPMYLVLCNHNCQLPPLFWFSTIYDHSNCELLMAHFFKRTSTCSLWRIIFVGLIDLTGTVNLINPLYRPGRQLKHMWQGSLSPLSSCSASFRNHLSPLWISYF